MSRACLPNLAQRVTVAQSCSPGVRHPDRRVSMLRVLAQQARLVSRAPPAVVARPSSLSADTASAVRRRLGARFSTLASSPPAPEALESIVPAVAPNLGSDAARRRGYDGLRRYNPTSAGTRHRVIVDKSHLWKGDPLRQLTVGIKQSGGRNNQGVITAWHRGGGNKRKYRIIDMKRLRQGEAATVERLEYDPNRSAHIALIRYADQSPAYILAPVGLLPGATVISFAKDAAESSVDISVGNCMTLAQMPTGVRIHALELRPGRGGQLVRAAGSGASLLAHLDDGYSLVRLPSGETRKVLSTCRATLGELSNQVRRRADAASAPAAVAARVPCSSPPPPGRLQRWPGCPAPGQRLLPAPRHTHAIVTPLPSPPRAPSPLPLRLQVWKNRTLGKAGASRWRGRRPHVRGVAMNPCDHPHGGGACSPLPWPQPWPPRRP